MSGIEQLILSCTCYRTPFSAETGYISFTLQ